MSALISVSDHETMLKTTGGVLVTWGAETTYGHLEQVPVEVIQGQDPGVITGEPSLVIANGALSGITHRTGLGESLTTDELDSSGVAVGSPTTWTVRDQVPSEDDGGTIRLMLKAG